MQHFGLSAKFLGCARRRAANFFPTSLRLLLFDFFFGLTYPQCASSLGQTPSSSTTTITIPYSAAPLATTPIPNTS